MWDILLATLQEAMHLAGNFINDKHSSFPDRIYAHLKDKGDRIWGACGYYPGMDGDHFRQIRTSTGRLRNNK